MNIAYISVAESLGISSTTFTDGRQHIVCSLKIGYDSIIAYYLRLHIPDYKIHFQQELLTFGIFFQIQSSMHHLTMHMKTEFACSKLPLDQIFITAITINLLYEKVNKTNNI